MAKRLRLLKVIVQPVFVVDDGETLLEQAAEPVTVPSAEWAEFAAGGLERAVAELQAGFAAANADSASTAGTGTANNEQIASPD